MDKKDIYEHLAKIYLDASSKRKKKNKYSFNLKPAIFVLIFAFLGISGAYTLRYIKDSKNCTNSNTALFVSVDAAKINFNFNPAKKETYSIDLNKLNLTKFKSLQFEVRKIPFEGKITMRVEFTNNFREKSEVYVKDLTSRWKKEKIDFADFKNINDWSEMANLSFSVETWNTNQEKGIVYIDNVRFVR